MSLTPVVVVRPPRSKQQALTNVFASIIVFAMDAWVVCLLAPVAFHTDISYARATAIVLVVQLLLKGRSLDSWSTTLKDWKER